MKTRKLLGILLALVMVVCLSTVAFAATEPTYTEVDTYDKLVTALGEGENVKLTADITAPDKNVLTISNQILDLGGKNLTLNGESGKLENGTIQNGTIEITTYEGDSVADGMFDVYGPATVSSVTFHSDGSAIYAIFDIKSGDLTMTGCAIDMVNNNSAGGLLYFNGGNKLTMTECTVTGTDIGDFITNGTVEMNDCTVTLKGTTEGALDNGINGTALTLNNTSVTIDGATGRGITTDGDAIAIKGTSNVTLTNCAEGGIRYKASAKIAVADTASLSGTVKVDAAATDAKVNETTVGVTGEKLPTVTVSEGTTAVKEYVYPFYVGTQGYDTLAEAIDKAQSGDTITLAEGTHTLKTLTKDLTFKGAEGTDKSKVIIDLGANVYSGSSYRVTVAFEGLTLDRTAAGKDHYKGFHHATKETYTDCIIVGEYWTYATTAAFTNCVFNQTSSGAYNLWTYGSSNVTLTGCTFNSAGKSVLVYNEGACATNLTVTDTDFIASAPVDGKAAIEIDSALLNYAEDGYHNIVIDEKTTAVGFGTGSVSGNSLWNNKDHTNNDGSKTPSKLNEVTVAGEKVLEVEFVAQIGETKYLTLQDALNAAAAGTGNVTVEILSDIDLTDVDWNPVTVSAPGYPVVTVNGNNKTITGLNDMLFAGTWAGNSGLIINDLTIANSKIVHDENDTAGNIGVGAFIGYPQASETITLNNCHLVNSTVSGGHWTGGLIGIAGGYSGDDGPVFMNLTITGCSVTGSSTITGKGSVGGVIGHGSCDAWTNVVITNTTVSGNTITSTGSDTNKAGAIMGTLGAAGQATTAAGETKTGGMSVDATTSNNTVTSNGTTITTIYGRQGTTTGVLTITGGCYENRPIAKEDTWAAAKEGYACYMNADGTWGVIEATEEEAKASATVTINVTPAGATVEIKKDDTVVGTAAGTYNLPGGTYTYTVSKPGYYTEEGTITVAGVDQTVTVSLAKLPTLYTITKAQCENGSVTAQAVMAAKGSTIKVSAVPAEGYKVWTLTVTDAAGNEIEIVDGKITMPASNITVSATFVYDLPFEDVADDAENYAAIAYMYENGLMIGTSTEQYIFDGDVKMTRSQIAQILYRLAGEPDVEYAGTFTDVTEGKWYTEAIEWAASKGIMVGVGDGTFAHNRQIKVVEMSALIYRYAQCQLTGECTSSDWATESAAAMTWCVENGVLAEGTDGTTIADRNLAAEMFYNVYNLLNK